MSNTIAVGSKEIKTFEIRYKNGNHKQITANMSAKDGRGNLLFYRNGQFVTKERINDIENVMMPENQIDGFWGEDETAWLDEFEQAEKNAQPAYPGCWV